MENNKELDMNNIYYKKEGKHPFLLQFKQLNFIFILF